MKAESEFWNVFHDGGIVSADGRLGATVRITIEIEYLRDMFEEPGTSFYVYLTACELLSFKAFDSVESSSSVDGLASLDLEIVSASEGAESTLDVLCLAGGAQSRVYGNLQLNYASSSITLDTGRAVSVPELFGASAKYWEDWAARRGE